MPLSVSVRDIQTLVQAFHPIVVIETVEEERVLELLQTATKDMSMPLFQWSIANGLSKTQDSFNAPWNNQYAPPGSLKSSALENTTEPIDVLKHISGLNIQAIFWLKDFGKHLEDAAVARQLREVAQDFSLNRCAIVITGENVSLPPEIAHDAVFYDLKLPERDELYKAVSQTMKSLQNRNRISIELQEDDVRSLVQALSGMTLKQARQVIAYAALEDGKLCTHDISRILHRKAQLIHEGGLLDYLPMDQETIDIGGFAGLKRWLAEAKVGFSPQAQAMNLPAPKGILIVGIQGCGKSLAAKSIARTWRMPLLKLDAGRLYDKYIGESEKNFRQAITLAESMAPTVLWIDEIEKSFLNGGNGGDTDGGLSQRMFGSFLTWMQEKSHEVFVVATANDISKIPPELLRKGRFDEIFFVDLPNAQERTDILGIHLTRRRQDPMKFDMPALVAATDGFSGAEIEQAVISSLYHALYLKKSPSTELMLEKIKTIIPLSVARREDLQRLRAIAQERFISVR